MRAFVAAALASLTLVAAGCGDAPSVRSSYARAGDLGANAARLVPADAVAFVSAETGRSSSQWLELDRLTDGLPGRARVLQQFEAALTKRGLSYERDLAPALGRELDYAVLSSGEALPEVVAFTQPSDEEKLRALASKFDSGDEHYTVQQIGGWSVVADSNSAFAAVRAASTGRSLADTSGYAAARAELDGDAIAWSFARPRSGPAWTAAKLDVGSDTVRASAAAVGNVVPAPAVPTLLRDVPAGAAFAAVFESSRALTSALRTAKLPQIPLAELAPLLDGGGIAYVRPKGIFPELAIELTPSHPEHALALARTLLRRNAGQLGPVQLSAVLAGHRLVIADSQSAAAALRGGAKLVNEGALKDALRAAGAPARTSALVYADVAQLAPFLQLAAAGSGKPLDPALGDTLGRIGALVAWSTRAGTTSRFELWVRKR